MWRAGHTRTSCWLGSCSFSTATRNDETFKSENSELEGKHVMTKLGDMWSKMGGVETTEWNEKAKKIDALKEKNQGEMDTTEETSPAKTPKSAKKSKEKKAKAKTEADLISEPFKEYQQKLEEGGPLYKQSKYRQEIQEELAAVCYVVEDDTLKAKLKTMIKTA